MKYILPYHTTSTHSDGTINVEYDRYNHAYSIKNIKITDISHQFLLGLILAVKSGIYDHCTFYFPYMPFGRQDRIEDLAGGKTIRISTLISLLKLLKDNKIKVYTDDPHSDVYYQYGGLANTQLQCISSYNLKSSYFNKAITSLDIIVAPDKGAKEKSEEIADTLGKDFLCATKERDPITKKILLSTDFTKEQIEGKVIGIFDDIMDYGTSVHDLAKQLKELGAKKVIVYITNGLCPLNQRISPPSRFDFVLSYVDELFFYNLKDGDSITHSNVHYLNSI